MHDESLRKNRQTVDITEEGPSLIKEMRNAGIKNCEGVNFSVHLWSEMASLLKQRITNGELFYPPLTVEKTLPHLLLQRTQRGKVRAAKRRTRALSHPRGTRDDVFWSVALGVYATVNMKEFDLVALRLG